MTIRMTLVLCPSDNESMFRPSNDDRATNQPSQCGGDGTIDSYLQAEGC